MLDEGIDIPQLSHAIMLSSSRNRRQFIQRRGRLLRKDKSKRLEKALFSKIWDIIVVPNISNYSNDASINTYKTHLIKEFERAEEFATDARNKGKVLHQISQLRVQYIKEEE